MNYKIEKEVVTKNGKQVEKNKIIMDVDESAPPSPSNLPDVVTLLKKIMEIGTYMCKDEIVELKCTNYSKYEEHMEKVFQSFATRYFAVFKKLISGEDITHLLSMLVALERVKKGEITLERAEKFLGEELAKEYIDPHINKKHKK